MTVIFRSDDESGNVLSVADYSGGEGKVIGIDQRHTGVRVSVGVTLSPDQVGELVTALFGTKNNVSLPVGPLKFEEWQLLSNLMRRFQANHCAPGTPEETNVEAAWRDMRAEYGRLYVPGE